MDIYIYIYLAVPVDIAGKMQRSNFISIVFSLSVKITSLSPRYFAIGYFSTTVVDYVRVNTKRARSGRTTVCPTHNEVIIK